MPSKTPKKKAIAPPALPKLQPLPDYNLSGAPPGTRAYSMGQATVLLTPPQAEVGWHLTVSYPRKVGRYPRWQEMAHARFLLIDKAVDMVLDVPPADAEPRGTQSYTMHMVERLPTSVLASVPATFADYAQGSELARQAQTDSASEQRKPLLSFVRAVPGGKMEIGRLMFDHYRIAFEGDADESARIFFKTKLEPLLNDLVKETFRYEWDSKLAKYSADELFLIEPNIGHFVLERKVEAGWQLVGNHPSIAFAKEQAEHVCDAYSGFLGATRWFAWEHCFNPDPELGLQVEAGRLYQQADAADPALSTEWRIVCIGRFRPPNTNHAASLILSADYAQG